MEYCAARQADTQTVAMQPEVVPFVSVPDHDGG